MWIYCEFHQNWTYRICFSKYGYQSVDECARVIDDWDYYWAHRRVNDKQKIRLCSKSNAWSSLHGLFLFSLTFPSVLSLSLSLDDILILVRSHANFLQQCAVWDSKLLWQFFFTSIIVIHLSQSISTIFAMYMRIRIHTKFAHRKVNETMFFAKITYVTEIIIIN